MKKLSGRTDIEDALDRLDRLMQEESLMAVVQGLKATHDVDNNVDDVENRVQHVDNLVQGIDDKVQRVDDKVQRVDNKVQGVDDTVRDIHAKIDIVIDGT
jgi:archaellum component FlaC